MSDVIIGTRVSSSTREKTEVQSGRNKHGVCCYYSALLSREGSKCVYAECAFSVSLNLVIISHVLIEYFIENRPRYYRGLFS